MPQRSESPPPPPAPRGFVVPRAGLAALLACTLLTALAWTGVRLQRQPSARALVWLGDSFTGNYRFAAPQRLQDLTALGPDWQVFNFARPGAFALDMLLQYDQARTLIGPVDAAVLPLFVGKLAQRGPYARLDERGDNLKWLRLHDDAAPVLQALDGELRKKLAIHKIGLLFGFYDLLLHLWVDGVQAAQERQRMRDNPADRQAGIAQRIAEHARDWHQRGLLPEDLRDGRAAQDLALLIARLRSHGTPLLIVLIPDGDPSKIDSAFSEQAKRHHQQAREAMARWCLERGVAFADATDQLGGGVYDDYTHLRDVRGQRVLASYAERWVQAGLRPGRLP